MEEEQEQKPVNILLGVTGSVATIKAALVAEKIVDECRKNDISVEIQVVASESSLHFLPEMGDYKIYRDVDEWTSWKGRGDPVLHIELRKWADVFVICPLSANTLARISMGISDNLLTCVCRAWDFKDRKKKILFAPAMNTMMWDHPVTSQQIDILKKWGYLEIPCVEKTLMCNDKGMGAMAEPSAIACHVLKAILSSKKS